MDNSVVNNIIEITLLLLAFSQTCDFYWTKYQATGRKSMKYATGVLIGFIGVVVMCVKVCWVENASIDTRTIILCLTGLLFGYIPSMIATAIMTIAALLMGMDDILLTSIEIIYMTAAISTGLLFRHINPHWKTTSFIKTILHVSLITQIIQYICISLIPTENKTELLHETIIPVLVMMPLSTLGLGHLMVTRAKNWNLDKKLRLSEEKFKKLVLTANDCYIEIDSLGRITEISDSIDNLLGYGPKFFIGKEVYFAIEDHESKNSLIQYLHSSDNEPYHKTLIFKHKKGHNIYCEAKGFKLKDKHSGIVNGYIGIIHNITDQHLASELALHNEEIMKEQNHDLKRINRELSEYNKKLKKANSELSETNEKLHNNDNTKITFINNIVQEIIDPLNDISKYSEILLESAVPETKRQTLLNKIKNGTDFLTQLTADLKDSNRIATGSMKINISIGNIDEMMADIYEYHNSRNLYIDKKNVVLNTTVDLPQEESIVKTDFLRLRQVLSNLITNAYRFTSNGKINVECRKYSSNELIFTVADTGGGIPEYIYEHIYTPFHHKETSSTKQEEFEHVGLGLGISKSLVEMMGGKMWFDSEVGKGTRFYFTLPLIPATEIAMQDNISYNWQDKTALVIGKEKYNNVLICEALLKTGIKYRNELMDPSDSKTPIKPSDFFSRYDIMIIDEDLITLPQVIEIMTQFSDTPIIITSESINISALYQDMDNKLKETI